MLIQESGCNIWQPAEPSQPTVLKCSFCIEMSDLWFLVTAAAWGCKHTPATLLSLPWPYQPNRLSAYYTAPLSFEGFSWSICVCLTSDGQKQIISSSFHIIFDKEGVRWMRRLIDLIIGRTPTQDYENGNLICVLGWHLLSVHGRDLIPSLHWRGDMIWYLINNLMTRPISSFSGAFNWITISTSSCPVYISIWLGLHLNIFL